MRFSEVLAAGTTTDGVWSTTVSEDWLQGRSLFGGIQAALALRAMRRLVPTDVPLRVLQTTFVAPVPAGRVAVQSRVLRTGKNVTQVEARIVDRAETSALVVGVFGRARESLVEVAPRTEVVRDEVHDETTAPAHVAFAQHFDLRRLRGDRMISGSRRTDAVLEIGMKDPGATVTEEHVLAIADAPPPLALAFLEKPAFGSSVTWTLEMLDTGLSALSLDGWQLHIDLAAAHDGYTSQSVLVCAAGGRPVALSRQSMVVFG
ncbi:MAG: acyl-CoA thioesterase [Polyangiaceae bacterium]